MCDYLFFLSLTHSFAFSGIYMVFVCSSERAFQSHIVTSMDKYKVDKFKPFSDDKISAYLKYRFFQDFIQPKTNRASVVDPENMMVRLVKSDKAGGGKTNKVLRLVERLKDQDHRSEYLCIRLHRPVVDISEVMAQLGNRQMDPSHMRARLIHVDVGQTVNYTLYFCKVSL